MNTGQNTGNHYFKRLLLGLLLVISCSRSEDSVVEPGKDINSLLSSVNVIPQSPDLSIDLFRFFLESVTVENEYTLLLKFNKAVAVASGDLASNFQVFKNDDSNSPLSVYGSLTSGDLVRVYTQTQAPGTEYRLEISNINCDGCTAHMAELKSPGVNLFKGWRFTASQASFQSRTQVLITFSAAVSCSVLQNAANYSVSGIIPDNTSVDGGCNTQSSSVRLNFAQPFSYGNYTLILSNTFESANSLQPDTRIFNLTLKNSGFYLKSALAVSANSVILKFSEDINTTGMNTSDFKLAEVIPDSVTIDFDYIVISSNQVNLVPDMIYMVSYRNVRKADNSAALSGKIGVPGLNTLQVASTLSPDFGRFNIFSTTQLDSAIASDALNFPGSCTVQSAIPDTDGSVCGAAGKCIRFNHTQSMTTCTISISNLKSSLGQNIYLEQSGNISLSLNSPLTGTGQILLGGRPLEYSSADNRVFNIKSGYLSSGNHILSFSGFSFENRPLAQENLTVAIP